MIYLASHWIIFFGYSTGILINYIFNAPYIIGVRGSPLRGYFVPGRDGTGARWLKQNYLSSSSSGDLQKWFFKRSCPTTGPPPELRIASIRITPHRRFLIRYLVFSRSVQTYFFPTRRPTHASWKNTFQKSRLGCREILPSRYWSQNITFTYGSDNTSVTPKTCTKFISETTGSWKTWSGA